MLFTLSSFLILAIGLLLMVWHFRQDWGKDIQKKEDVPKIFGATGLSIWAAYQIGFTLLCIWGIITAYQYRFPSTDIFTNTDFHILEHHGYDYMDSLNLVNSSLNEESLWDEKDGLIQLTSLTDSQGIHLAIKDYHEPFYVREIEPQGTIFTQIISRIRRNINPADDAQHRLTKEMFHLANPIIKKPIQDSLQISLINKDRFIKIYFTENKAKDSSFYHIQLPWNKKPIESGFKQKINRGYGINDIILSTPNLQTDSLNQEDDEFLDQILNYLDGSLLLRQNRYFKGTSSDYARVRTPLLFHPGQNVLLYKDLMYIIVDGDTIKTSDMWVNTQEEFQHPIEFFSGFGYRQGVVHKLTRKDESKFSLRFKYPERFKLKSGDLDPKESETLVHHFLTSRSEEVIKSRLEGGIYSNLLTNPKNKNHIFARLKYLQGDAKQPFLCNVLDYEKIDQGNFDQRKDSTYLADLDQEIYLYTKSSNKLRWNFQLKNLQKESPISHRTIIGILLVCWIFVVPVRFYWIHSDNKNIFTPTELAAYIVLFAFLLVKLVLMWRMYVFPPMDNPLHFFILTQDKYLITLIVSLLLFLGTWLFMLFFRTLKRSGNPVRDKKKYGIQLIQNSWNKWYKIRWEKARYVPGHKSSPLPLHLHVVTFLLGALILFLLSDRFFNIGVPLLLYFQGNWWLANSYKNYLATQVKHATFIEGLSHTKEFIAQIFQKAFDFLFHILNPPKTQSKSWIKQFIAPKQSFPKRIMLSGGILFFFILSFSGLYLLSSRQKARWRKASNWGKLGLVLVYLASIVGTLGILSLITYLSIQGIQTLSNWVEKWDTSYITDYWILFTLLGVGIICLVLQVIGLINIPKALQKGRDRIKMDTRRMAKISIDLSSFILLFAFDAGFSIIFLMYYFLHQVLGGLYFPESYTVGSAIRKGVTKYLGKGWEQRIIYGLTVLLMGIFLVTLLYQDRLIYRGLDMADSKAYIKYRAAINELKVDDLLNASSYNSPDNRAILNASHNRWFINSYIHNRNKDKFWDLRDHFNQGSSYITQTTDLVVSRYIIAEHGNVLVLALISMLLFFSFICSLYHFRKRQLDNSSYVIFGVALLLFSISFFVWLTATNRFTFFGQDFPFISLTSTFAVLSFLIFLLLILKHSLSNLLPQPSSTTSSSQQNQTLEKEYPLHFVHICIFLLGFIIYFMKTEDLEKKETEHSNYNVTQLLNSANNILSQIDKDFMDYQVLKSGNGWNLETLLDSFKEEKQSRIDEILGTKGNYRSNFLGTAFDDFFAVQLNKRDPAKLIHIRKRNGRFHFAINRKYYFVKGPKPDTYWEGDLLAAEVKLRYGLQENTSNAYLNDTLTQLDGNILSADKKLQSLPIINNIQVMFVPPSWGVDEFPTYLVKCEDGAKGGRFSIINDQFIANNTDNLDAMEIEPNDFIALYERRSNNLRRVYRLTKEKDRFLAKNIWLNGQRQFHFPMGEKFSWAYNFTRLVNDYTEHAPAGKPNLNSNKDSLRLSIDYDLTDSVYNLAANLDNVYDNSIRLQVTKFVHRLRDKTKRYSPSYTLHLADKSSKGKNETYPVIDPSYIRSKDLLKFVKTFNQDWEEYLSDEKTRRKRKKLPQLNKYDYPDLMIAQLNEMIKGEFDFSMVAMDAKGRIRLMVDYNKAYRINPNDIDEYYAFLRRIYTESTISMERDYLGNKSLLTMNPGPGSSIKPIMLSSFISQADVDLTQINIKHPTAAEWSEITKHTMDTLHHYAGQKLRGSDRWTGLIYRPHVTARNYITFSDNTFHSVMMFLGSYPRTSIEEAVNLVRRGRSSDILQRKIPRDPTESFPILSVYGNQAVFPTDQTAWPHNTPGLYFGNPRSAVAEGLSKNYDLVKEWNEFRQEVPDAQGRAYNRIRRYETHFNTPLEQSIATYGDSTQKQLGVWSLPERSHFIQLRREGSFRTGLIQPSLGADPVKISPLKMANMGLILYTRNNQISPTLMDSVAPIQVQNFETFPAIDERSHDIGRLHRDLIYLPMNNVLGSVNGRAGTARNLGLKINRSKRYEGLHFYAKTGTINDPLDKKRRGKHLLLVISRNPLHQNPDIPYEEQKIYAVYISLHAIPLQTFNSKIGGQWSKILPFIDQVVQSNTFQRYMFDRDHIIE